MSEIEVLRAQLAETRTFSEQQLTWARSAEARARQWEARATAAEQERKTACEMVDRSWRRENEALAKLAAAEQREAEKDDEIRRVIRIAKFGMEKAAGQSAHPCDHLDDASLRFMAIADMLTPLLASPSTPSPAPAAAEEPPA